MLRFVLFAFALATILVTGRPVFADPVEIMACDHGQAAAAATQQATPVPASSGAPETTAPATGKDSSPVGFGWG